MTSSVTRHRKTLFALSALAIALAAVPFADFDRALESLVGAVYAADSHSSGGGEDKGKGGKSDGGHSSGGHTSGGSSSGSHSSGGGSSGGGSSGGHSSGGGHDAGGDSHSGGKGGPSGHGMRQGHEGHASGQHAGRGESGGASHGSRPIGHVTDRRFGGGNGGHANDLVPEGPGQHGSMAQHGSVTATRFRYWGGWSVPDDDGVAPTTFAYTAPTEVAPLGSGGGGGAGTGTFMSVAGRCDDVGGKVSASARLSGRNLARIAEVQKLIAQPVLPAAKMAPPYLLANFQEELSKSQPDTLLAGTYLGMAARVSVTPELVTKVAFQLCVPCSDVVASKVAEAASVHRVAGTE
jgi:hypothetical protein